MPEEKDNQPSNMEVVEEASTLGWFNKASMVSRNTFNAFDPTDISLVADPVITIQPKQLDDHFITEHTRDTFKFIQSLFKQNDCFKTFEEILDNKCSCESKTKNRTEASMLFSDLLVLGVQDAIELKQELFVDYQHRKIKPDYIQVSKGLSYHNLDIDI